MINECLICHQIIIHKIKQSIYLNSQLLTILGNKSKKKSNFLGSRYKTTNQLEQLYLQILSLSKSLKAFVSMFNLYLKREQYGKVSSKFKNHFEKRDEKVNFVNSNDHKLQEKMKAFNQLINDDFHNQRKLNLLNSSSSYDKRMPKLNSTQMFGYPSKSLTGQFYNWQNPNSYKSLHKENISGWVNLQKEKQKIGYKSQKNFKQNLNLTKTQTKISKFLIDMKKKIQGIPGQEMQSKHQSSQDKQSSCENQSILEDKKRSKQKKHKRQLSQDLDLKNKDDNKNITINKNLKKSSMNTTLFCDSKTYKNSVFKEQFDKNQSENEDDFKDDSIQNKISPIVNRKSIDEQCAIKIERNVQTKSHQLSMNPPLKPIKRQSYAHNLTGFFINPSKRKLAPLTEKKNHSTVVVHNPQHL